MDKDNGNGLLAAHRILFDSNTSLTVSVQVQLEGSGKYFSVLVLCKIKKCSGKFCRKQQFYFKIFCRCMGRFQDHILGLICWTEQHKGNTETKTMLYQRAFALLIPSSPLKDIY